MPNERLNVSQMITIGANIVPILEVPSGCRTKSTTNIAQVTPTIVGLVMVGSTILRLGQKVSQCTDKMVRVEYPTLGWHLVQIEQE